MNVIEELNDELLKQPFIEDKKLLLKLDECKKIASIYAQIENSIAVLSDMKANNSYIYYGKIAQRFGIMPHSHNQTIQSIWEEEIFNRIHPDDLFEKHIQELRFLTFLRSVPEKERKDYYVINQLRMRDVSEDYTFITHRMFYIARHTNGSIWLSLCLYNLSPEKTLKNIITNSATGAIIDAKKNYNNILSGREKEVLRLIDQGKKSKDIAISLSISINTINRHRQNILEKLHVNKSIKACAIAKELNLI